MSRPGRRTGSRRTPSGHGRCQGGALDRLVEAPDPQHRVALAEPGGVEQPEPLGLGDPQSLAGALHAATVPAVRRVGAVDRRLEPLDERAHLAAAEVDHRDLAGPRPVRRRPPVAPDVRHRVTDLERLRHEEVVDLREPVRRADRGRGRVVGELGGAAPPGRCRGPRRTPRRGSGRNPLGRVRFVAGEAGAAGEQHQHDHRHRPPAHGVRGGGTRGRSRAPRTPGSRSRGRGSRGWRATGRRGWCPGRPCGRRWRR